MLLAAIRIHDFDAGVAGARGDSNRARRESMKYPLGQLDSTQDTIGRRVRWPANGASQIAQLGALTGDFPVAPGDFGADGVRNRVLQLTK